MAVFVFAAVFADVITVYNPVTTNSAVSLMAPGPGHVLGADAMGRDIYSRLVYGARVSLLVGLAVALISVVSGLFFGLLAGFFRLLDAVIDLAVLATAVLLAWRLAVGMLDKKAYFETTFILGVEIWQAYALALVGAVAFRIVPLWRAGDSLARLGSARG